MFFVFLPGPVYFFILFIYFLLYCVRVSCYVFCVLVFPLCYCLIVSTSVIGCLEGLVSEMTHYVSSATLNATPSLSIVYCSCQI